MLCNKGHNHENKKATYTKENICKPHVLIFVTELIFKIYKDLVKSEQRTWIDVSFKVDI